MMNRWQRQLEAPSKCFPGEFWNTWTNLPFVVIGLWRLHHLRNGDGFMWWLYVLYTAAGVCSAVHHMLAWRRVRWSLVVDWLPIGASLAVLLCHYPLLIAHVTRTSAEMVAIALAVLLGDHVCTPLPVPVGHCLWHVMAALAVDAVYVDLMRGEV